MMSSSAHCTLAHVLLQSVSTMLVAVTAPLILELLLLTSAARLPRRKRNESLDSGTHSLTLVCIVPAHNEELLVGRCVRSLRTEMPANCEVIVIAHRCTDGTVEQARKAGAQVLVFDTEEQTGKGSALKFGFAYALAKGAEAVAVVDADSIVSTGFLATLQRRLSTDAEAVQCSYVVLDGEHHSRTRLGALAFQGFNVIRPRGRERLGLSCGIFGNGFALRAEVLKRVPYSALSLVEDLEYHLALVSAGVRVRFLDNTFVRSEMPVSVAGNASQKARWEGGRVRTAGLHAPRLLGVALRGNLRALEPLTDILSLPIAIAFAVLAIAFCLPVPWLRIYGLLGLATILVHGAVAAAEGKGFLSGLQTLIYAPRYIVWKLMLLPRTLLASRRETPWVRTAREIAEPCEPT